MNKKIMLIQPLEGASTEKLMRTRDDFLEFAKIHNYDVVDALCNVNWSNAESSGEHEVLDEHLYMLAKRLESMSRCDAVYFAHDWESDDNCRIERDLAITHGLDIIEVVKKTTVNDHEIEIIKVDEGYCALEITATSEEVAGGKK